MNETEQQASSEATGQESRAADPTLGVATVTIASSRTLASDSAGKAIETAIERTDHELTTREHVGTDHDRVQSIVSRVIERDDVDLVVTAGATSVEPTDIAIEAVEPLLEKKLPAFDHLFTSLAYEAVGTRVVAARTLAGVAEETPVFCLPGDEAATRLGIEEIVLPEATHLVDLARADREREETYGTDDGDEPMGNERDDGSSGGGTTGGHE
ncbi:molybdenum cofactor biosynthesis protein [Natrarchaeobius halalkaliphilus]|uniref:Molybdenum cofactor biosynthesis protein n=1 Tax=Natrarchaeobius halalkaliphilus TaxID=1679091 RepID=A0A3N6LPJ8_9EURY|nr:molybdopterin-binding protein [Natrarchaeobius halalkaliphilus]RQG88784.1 molybdenum cofactor biosynthesis protein [Natrarchaeobius halalkaliphilus]